MIASLTAHRQGISDAIRDIAAQYGSAAAQVNDWGPDLLDRLVDFATAGKLIRGSLVVATASLFGTRPDESLYTIAAALELVQSFLLIHDDIMDQDPVRRGKQAIYTQYQNRGQAEDYRDWTRFGESMGICAGDVAILLAIEAVASLPVEPAKGLQLVRLISAEISKVGIAQMADVANGHRPNDASADEIVSVYRYKTGRYTFSLPMMLGALYAGQSEAAVDALSEWGELQGVVFQIRDDQLGVMSETEEIGKPAGSDITSDKQTLHRLEFLARCGADQPGLAELFGSDSIASEELDTLRSAMQTSGVLDALERRVRSLRAKAAEVIQKLDLTSAQREALAEIDAFNAERSV